MPEYIERETLFEEIRKEFRPYWQIPCDYEDKVTQKMVTKMRGLIDKLPPADVVEVVRCRDCKFATELDKHCELSRAIYKHCSLLRGEPTDYVWHKYKRYHKNYSLVEADDYCSYGIRKDGD